MTVSQDQRDKFKAALAQARSNLQDIAKQYGANSQEYKKAERALGVYGEEGVKNGVTIFAQEGPGGARTDVEGVAGRKTADNPTGQNIRIAIDPDKFDLSTFSRLIAHEGSHAADGSDWVKSGFSERLNPTIYQGEVTAYTVQSIFAQVQNPDSYSYIQLQAGFIKGKNPYLPEKIRYWDAGWKEADRAVLRQAAIDRLLARPKNAGGDYGVTPASQGGKGFRRGSRF